MSTTFLLYQMFLKKICASEVKLLLRMLSPIFSLKGFIVSPECLQALPFKIDKL
jgi:hypothetical protein